MNRNGLMCCFFFVPECTRTSLRPWRDSCSSCTKVACVLTCAAATLAGLQSVLLSDLGDGQTRAQHEKMLSCIDVFFLINSSFFCFTGTLQEYQRRMKKLDQQYKERLRNAGKPRKFSLRFLFRCIRADLVRSLSLWASVFFFFFFSFALLSVGQRINRAPT